MGVGKKQQRCVEYSGSAERALIPVPLCPQNRKKILDPHLAPFSKYNTVHINSCSGRDRAVSIQKKCILSWSQFQPSEFSAITGAEICAVRTLRPLLLPLPLLSRPPGVDRPGPRPPDIQAAPIIEPPLP